MAIVWIELARYSTSDAQTGYSAFLTGDQTPPPGSILRVDWDDMGLPDGGTHFKFVGYEFAGTGVIHDYRGSTFEYPANAWIGAVNSTFYFDDAPGSFRMSQGELRPPNAGSNTFHMGDGDDVLALGGTSTVYGGGGDDAIISVAYADGGAGNDTFRGVDEIHGGDGDDLATSSSVETFYGGAGFDEIRAGNNVNLSVGLIDRVERISTNVALTILDQHLPAGQLSIDDYFDDIEVIFATQTRVPEILLGDGASNILGPATFAIPGYDTLKLYLGGGDDRYRAQTHDSAQIRAYGEEGADVMRGTAGRDELNGGADDDDIKGRGGDDLLSGGEGDDLVRGSRGDDRILAGYGDDIAYGNRGDDVLGGDDTDFPWYAGNDQLFGGLGSDKLSGIGGDDLLYGDRGRDSLYGDAGDDSLFGGDGHDSLFGGEGDDLLDGEDRGDEIYGSAGQDTVYGDAGRDTIDGGEGADQLHGNRGDDTLFGGGGEDELRGGAGDDLLFGGEGADAMFGGKGDDTIDFGLGANTATGDQGADVFVVAIGDGPDTALDFETGLDRIRIQSGAATFEELEIAERGGITYVTYGLTTDVIALVDVEAGDLDAADFIFAA